jgi:Zn-dependent M32 family carboxypeptidase
MKTYNGNKFIEKKEQQELFNWLHKTFNLPARVYEIYDMLNMLNKIDVSINDYENNIKIIQIERQLKNANEAILQTLKTIEEKKQTK